MLGYKIFSFLYRFVCVCQYDFYSYVCFYTILVIGGFIGLTSPILGIFRFTGFQPERRSMKAAK
jgi:hypothetical protein